MFRSHPEPRAGDAPAAAHGSELEREIRGLHARLAALTEQVSRNDSLLRKTQERELELLRADSLAQLFERLIEGLQTSYQLDDVELFLHDPQHEIRHLLSGDGLQLEQLPGVCFVDALTTVAPQLASLERPWLGPFHKADHELLLPGVAPPGRGSLALIPLRRHEQLDGVLVFSSADPLRFTQELASDFLAHLGWWRRSASRTPSIARACCAADSPISLPVSTTAATCTRACAQSWRGRSARGSRSRA